MFRVPFVAGVLFTATLVTSGAADAHVHSSHRSHDRSHRGPAHLASRHHSARPAAHHAPPRRAGSRVAAGERHDERHGGAPAGTQTGGASYYQGGHRTAAGGSVGAATCAHRTLPFGTRVLVTNLANARAAVLTVNDRGPFVRGRVLDVSTAAAGVLGMLHAGVAQVRVQVVGQN